MSAKKENKENKVISFASFNTAGPAEVGVKLPLKLPDGTETEHWLLLRGGDSEVFQRARKLSDSAVGQAYASKESMGDEEFSNFLFDEEQRLIAHLVKDWSNDEECNVENVVKFLKGAPQIADEINSFSGKRSNFSKSDF